MRKITLKVNTLSPQQRELVAYKGKISGAVCFPKVPGDFSGHGVYFCSETGRLENSITPFSIMEERTDIYTPVYKDEDPVLEITL